MSAIGVLPWPVHQAYVYLAGVFAILSPFVLDLTEGPTLPLLVGTGVVLLAIGVLSRGPGGVAQVLPHSVHGGLLYVLGFFLVVAPFLFRFAEDETALLLAVLLGLVTIVVTLVTRFPGAAARRGDEAREEARGDETRGDETRGDETRGDETPEGTTADLGEDEPQHP